MVCLLLILPFVTGCYHYAPIGEARPAVGTEVRFHVTDRGRLEVTDRLGPGIREVAGPVLQATDSTIRVSVQSVSFVDDSRLTEWTGQWLELSRELVTNVRERRFSRARTLVTTGVLATAAILISTIDITGHGGDGVDVKLPPGPGDQM